MVATDSTKLPDGSTAVRVGVNGERIVVSPGNAYRPPSADYLKGGRRSRLVPADAIESWAACREDVTDPQYEALCDLLDRLSGAPKFSPPIERRTG